MIEISQTKITALPEDIESARLEFETKSCVVLPGLFPLKLANSFLSRIDSSVWREKQFSGEHKGPFARDLTMEPASALVHGLHLLLNNRKLFEVIRQITSCAEIGCFQGRIYRQLPAAGHHLDWHDDMLNSRLVGLSVNLSSEIYEGAVFNIRRRTTGEVLNQVTHALPGWAHIFRIDPSVEHCLTPLSGCVPRTALAGWFQSSPKHSDLLARGKVKLDDRQSTSVESI